MKNGKRRKNGPDEGQERIGEKASEAPADAGGVSAGVPVVGLGGSAGAFECFKDFFKAMPPDSGAAFVVIQHLAPAHESMLPELLAHHTPMQVLQARDGMPVEPNSVYVIPPNSYLGLRDGALFLAEAVKKDGIRLPIDFFFRSLAEDRRELAVCVLFSGAGSDGTLGVRAIRGAGGLTIAQDPQTAQYGDMPRNAIATTMVDYILPPDRIPQAITDYLQQPYVRVREPAAVPEAESGPAGFSEILAIVQAQSGNDFRHYKKGTLLRRVERRMGLHRISDVGRYGELLSRDANEVKQLYKDLLINVTAFFRDTEAFEELRRMAIVPLVMAKGTDEPLRVWVAGCSTGEEAYSIVMLLIEELAAAGKTCPFQVFATDIDQEALEFARRGVYPESIVADVGTERLAKFFIRGEHGYRIGDSLRNAVIFAAQNLIADPPFSRMDLLSCRNLLIYLDVETQAKLMRLFNFALNPDGCLFLGKSEGIGGQVDLFGLVSKKGALYRSRPVARPIILDAIITPGRKGAIRIGPPPPKAPAASYADVIRQALLAHFAAGVVLTDARGHVLQFHGQTGRYLNMPTTEPILDLRDIAKEGLATRLRSALHTAMSKDTTVVLDQVPITLAAGSPFARVTVTPLARRGDAEPLLAVFFEDIPRPAISGAETVTGGGSEGAVLQLEDELRVTQQQLQSMIEELQSANEELRVSNEEVVSTNEELQSTIEELETSKEELQSVNEELTTVNSQLQEKVERLDAANADMANLLQSTQIATLFLDGESRIKLFTPATTRILKLIPTDMGRPVSDLSAQFLDYDLMADTRAVLQGGPVVEREVRHADGSSYLVRVFPYLAKEGRVEGVVATFIDVTRLRRAEERTRRLATVLEDSNDAVILSDVEGHIQAWNRGAEKTYGWSEAEALRMNVRDLSPGEEGTHITELIQRLLGGEIVVSSESRRHTKEGRVLDVWLTITAVPDESGKLTTIATTERDITAHKAAAEVLRKAREEGENQRRLEAVMEALPVGVAITDDRGGSISTNHAYEQIWGAPRPPIAAVSDYVPYRAWWVETGKPVQPAEWASAQAVTKGEAVFGQLLEIERFDGVRRQVINSAAPFRDEAGKILGSAVAIQDITELRQAQRSLLKSEKRLALAASATRIGMFDWDMAEGSVLWTRTHEVIFGYAPAAADATTLTPLTTLTTTATETTRHEYRTWADRVHPEDLPRVEEHLRRCRRECTPFESQYRIIWPNGSVHWIETRATFVCGSDGKAVRMLGVVMDISDRRQVEDELRRNRGDLNRAQSVAHVGSWRLDVRRNELLWSEENWRIFGVAQGTPLSYEIFLATVHPDDREFVNQKWQAAMRGEPYDIEHRIVVAGQSKWVRERAELEFDRGGELLGAFGTSQDITDRKAAEEALQQTAGQLARSNQDLEHFAYIASHDLQEPLRMVTGFLGLLKDRYRDRLDAKADEWIFHAVDGARRMSELIDDLLAYGRVDRTDPQIGPTRAQKALNRALAILQTSIEEVGAKITQDELPTVLADGTQLAQLFQNLIGNAVKFRREGTPCEIHIGARHVGAQWVFSVRDNGIGISEHQFDRIFLIFQRLHKRGKYPGTGVGLAICKRIVERFGGRIWVESRVGEGSTFFFTVPSAGEAAA